MIEQIPSFSRARTLLPGAGKGRENALAGTGEAEVLLSPVAPTELARSGSTEARLDAAEQRVLACEAVDVVHVQRTGARSGSFGDWPDQLDPRLLAALNERIGPRPYAHQARALASVFAGRDVVLSTSTASGKSLCFQVPVLDAVLHDDRSRALMMFPTKALARDQVESMRSLAAALPGGTTVGVATYDGDTPPDQRRAARARAHAVATNPDMLHRGVLPHHERWAEFLSGLRYIVLDELHVYRGLFGSHVANVLRRLWRVCAHYGSAPQVIACSATIGNPDGLAAGLCPFVPARADEPLGADDDPDTRARFALVDEDTAPAGAKTFIVANPRVVDETTGVRRDYLKVTRAISTIMMQSGVTTLAFCRTRKAVELLTRYLREEKTRTDSGGLAGAVGPKSKHGTDDGSPKAGSRPPLRLVGGATSGRTASTASAGSAERAIRGYRGGYLPERRREVEQALREGEAQLVASTNALELGMDIGGVDAVVLSGYPGTRAATMQRSGRAGRRGRPSLSVLVMSSAPLDQFVAGETGFLFERAPELARIDPDNPEILVPHLRCAAHELPFGGDAVGLPGLDAAEQDAALAYVAEQGGLLREEVDGHARYHAIGPSPAQEVDLRGGIEENFTVLSPAGDVLAQVDFKDAPLYLHEGAIYAIEGRPHEVRALDWDGRKANVRAVAADYYTEAISKTRVRVVDPSSELEPQAHTVGSGVGYAQVLRHVPGFKKIRLHTHENIGFGPINLPDLELQTTAAFWGLRTDAVTELTQPQARAAATLAAAHAMHHVAAMTMMCDVGDLGHAVLPGHPGAWGMAIGATRGAGALAEMDASAVPHVVLYDQAPGGAGLSVQAFTLGAAFLRRVEAVVVGCGCKTGCPTCMGPQSDAAESYGVERAHVAAVLRALASEPPGPSEAPV